MTSKDSLTTRVARWVTKNPKKTMLIVMLLNLTAILAYMSVSTLAQDAGGGTTGASGRGLGLIGAGLAIAGSTIGAGIAVYGATSAGIAAIVERPGTAVWVLLFAGLGEGIAVWGFAIAIMILGALP